MGPGRKVGPEGSKGKPNENKEEKGTEEQQTQAEKGSPSKCPKAATEEGEGSRAQVRGKEKIMEGMGDSKDLEDYLNYLS